MKAHRTLTLDHVTRRGPATLALMVASEFLRAAGGAGYRSDVIACFGRARELMGALETLPMPSNVARTLKPVYKRCRESELLQEKRLDPAFVERASRELADAFEQAAAEMASKT